jgi:hypothetical protein
VSEERIASIFRVEEKIRDRGTSVSRLLQAAVTAVKTSNLTYDTFLLHYGSVLFKAFFFWGGGFQNLLQRYLLRGRFSQGLYLHGTAQIEKLERTIPYFDRQKKETALECVATLSLHSYSSYFPK